MSGCRKPTSVAALETLIALDRDKKLLSRDIASDRSADRRPGHGAALRRAAAQARAEALKDKKAKRKGGDA